jgi:hypothetical protein
MVMRRLPSSLCCSDLDLVKVKWIAAYELVDGEISPDIF